MNEKSPLHLTLQFREWIDGSPSVSNTTPSPFYSHLKHNYKLMISPHIYCLAHPQLYDSSFIANIHTHTQPVRLSCRSGCHPQRLAARNGFCSARKGNEMRPTEWHMQITHFWQRIDVRVSSLFFLWHGRRWWNFVTFWSMSAVLWTSFHWLHLFSR